jgi:glycosyltransferase involved in cell wall biosynthesis
MRIVYCDHYAGSPELGMEFRPFQLAREWVRSGHAVTIVGGSYSHLRVRNPSPGREVLDGVEFLWLKTPEYRGNGLGRIRSMVAYCLGLRRAIRRLSREGGIDAIIASSTYPFDFLVTHRAARRVGAASVFELHDLWPESVIELGGYSRRHPFVVATQYCEDAYCRKADRVISIIPHADRHLATRGLAPERYLHIPNGIDPGDAPEPSSSPPPNLEAHADWISSGFSIGFAGSLTDSYSIEPLLRASVEAKSRLLVMGDGPSRERLERLAAELGADARFTGRLKRGDALHLLSRCGAIFVGLNAHPLFERYGISMNKLYDGMLCGRPILANYTSANDPVTEAACGIATPAGDVAAIVAAIRRLSSMSSEALDAMGSRGRRFVSSRHDHRVLAERMLESIASAARRMPS